MKYVIEVESIGNGLWKAKGFNTLVFDQTGLNKLTTYKDPAKGEARLLKYLDAAYKNGFEDGRNKATEVMKKRAATPYDAMGDYSGFTTADDWYREEFIRGFLND